MDQTNPLSEVTHKRRLSALGPGGLTRERAGFEVRDVHPTHYGRICPIETPEGPNIGLINSLATYAKVNKYGFIETPYMLVKDGVVQQGARYLSAMEEEKLVVAQADAPMDGDGRFTEDLVSVRRQGDFRLVRPEDVTAIDVSPKQLVSVAAALIPFLENDDANRALMGSNMQRQAVPLIQADAPLVGTGMEAAVARDSGATIIARRAGVVDQIDGARIVVRATNDDGTTKGVDIYRLRKFMRSNQSTCINQRPLVRVGDVVQEQRDHRRRAFDRARRTGAGAQRAGRVHAVERLQLRGLDPDLRAHRARRRVHLHPHRGIRGDGARHQAGPGGDHARHPQCGRGSAEEPRRGRHRLYRRGSESGRHPGRQGHAEGRKPDDAGGKTAARDLRREGVRRARHVAEAAARGDRHGGGCARVQPPRRRQGRARDGDRACRDRTSGEGPRRREGDPGAVSFLNRLREKLLDRKATGGFKGIKAGTLIDEDVLAEHPRGAWRHIGVQDDAVMAEIETLKREFDAAVGRLQARFDSKVEKLQRGDELPPGVMKMVKVFIAVKRKLQPGDKMAGRHGNKGVVSRVVPVEDMPFLEDGTSVDLVLNPLGVPSRMNVGQILETHLGWACHTLGAQIGELVEEYRRTGARREASAGAAARRVRRGGVPRPASRTSTPSS